VPVAEQLGADDYDAVSSLLINSKLQISDLTPEALTHFLGIREEATITAVGGIEVYGPVALLRSIAVAGSSKGQGYGLQIVHALEAGARRTGIETLYLLTESADAFFARLGYRHTARDDVPAAIRTTAQFSALCPESAACMAKHLA
jgi:amino-acid N-acetyltransferase